MHSNLAAGFSSINLGAFTTSSADKAHAASLCMAVECLYIYVASNMALHFHEVTAPGQLSSFSLRIHHASCIPYMITCDEKENIFA